jgi:putative intracellular protease/amidase
MNVYVLLYEGFAAFEITPLLLLLKKAGNVVTFSFDREPRRSEEQLEFVVEKTIDDVDPAEVDVLIIPGGDPEPYAANAMLHGLLRELRDSKKVIGAICGGPGFLAHAGLLEGLRVAHGYSEKDAQHVFAGSVITDEDVIVEDSIITARGQAYAEFAVEVTRQLGLFESEEEAKETLAWLKNVR